MQGIYISFRRRKKMYSKQQELLEKTLAGDDRAKSELVGMYQPLARKTASYFLSFAGDNPSVSFDDLLSEANYGFLVSLKTYDPGKGHAFTAYVENGMRMAVRKYLSVCSRPIRLPKYQIERMSRLDRCLSKLDGRSPDVLDISERTGMSTDVVMELFEIRNTQRCLSLDLGDDGESPSICDMVGCDDFTAEYERCSIISDIFSFLRETGDRESYIVKALTGCFGEEKRTARQISVELGISVSTVRKCYADMLSRMRMQFSVA